MNMQRFTLGELWTNCYLVWDDERNGLLVDPGGDAKAVRKFIEDNGVKLAYILLTHGHADHIAGLDDVRGLAKNGVAIHCADAECLTNAEKNLSGAFGNGFRTKAAEKLISDGDIFNIGKLRIEVLHTPGHTPGGVSFYIMDGVEQIILCGDTLFARSVGRTDLPGGNEETLIKSLKRFERFENEVSAYPGHGPSTTVGEEKKYNPFWPR